MGVGFRVQVFGFGVCYLSHWGNLLGSLDEIGSPNAQLRTGHSNCSRPLPEGLRKLGSRSTVGLTCTATNPVMIDDPSDREQLLSRDSRLMCRPHESLNHFPDACTLLVGVAIEVDHHMRFDP